jgi:hypothetical protein
MGYNREKLFMVKQFLKSVQILVVLSLVIGFGMTVNAQTPNKTVGGAILSLIPLLVCVIVGICYYLYTKKRAEKKQTQLNEIFQAKGFSNTELILTEGSLSPTCNFSQTSGLENPTFNVLIGAKDGVLSFFCVGKSGRFTIKNGAVSLSKKFVYLPFIDFFFIDNLILKEKKFRHLFDIPVSNIVKIVPQQKEKWVVVLNIHEKSGKITMLCFHCQLLNELNIAFTNILMEAFEIIFKTESISKEEIFRINKDIQDAKEEGKVLLGKKLFKGFSTVILASAIVGGIAISKAGKESFKYA